MLESINPTTGASLRRLPAWDADRIEAALASVARAAPLWAATPIDGRAALLRRIGALLRERKEALARTITLEMGKLLREALAEVEKCAGAFNFYADHAEPLLRDEPVASDAARSLIVYQPLGTLLAVMPWNFPFWQVCRAAAPALAAGNTLLLKHASNVSECAEALEAVMRDAGVPDGVFVNLPITSGQVQGVVEDRRVHAVTLTGSDAAGRKVAAAAGAVLKKTVLELGGSDAFIVLPDADLDTAVQGAVLARFQNAGQSCIAGKRFILVGPEGDRFLERFVAAVAALRPGDPLDPATTLGPLARHDLRDELHAQVTDAVGKGARVLTGGAPLPGPGAFYAATVLTGLTPAMRAWREELFGPVALVLRAADEEEAVRLANDSPFGLGASVWTADAARGERLARRLEAGCAFVNGVVKSDPRLPFGGVKASGYGRELSHHGLREFVNVKTLWIR